eukprot:381598-Pyramimonas_sp.AAC.2
MGAGGQPQYFGQDPEHGGERVLDDAWDSHSQAQAEQLHRASSQDVPNSHLLIVSVAEVA